MMNNNEDSRYVGAVKIQTEVFWVMTPCTVLMMGATNSSEKSVAYRNTNGVTSQKTTTLNYNYK
jgi:hypothetical protein